MQADRFDAAGEMLTIRPIRPEDAPAHDALFHRLPAEDIRFRFFAALRVLPPGQMARLTQVDFSHEMALVAVRADGQTVAVARLVRLGDTPEGEFAVIVQPDMKGRGLARHMVQRLIEWGRDQGLAEIFGEILADNRAMLAFARNLGFTLQHRGGDVIEARLRL